MKTAAKCLSFAFALLAACLGPPAAALTDKQGTTLSQATIDPDFTLYLPHLIRKSPDGERHFWAKLAYTPANGKPAFSVAEYGEFSAGGAPSNDNPAILTATGKLVIPDLTMRGNNARSSWRAELAIAPGAPIALEVTDYATLLSTTWNKNRVMLGLLNGARVEVFSPADLTTPLMATTTDSLGHFDTLNVPALEDEAILIVKASGGVSSDSNGDGLPDSATLPNQGSVYAIVSAGQLRYAQVLVSPVSDIAWQYARAVMENQPPEALWFRLNDIARAVFHQDISGDGAITYHDLAAFNPTYGKHILALNFGYPALLRQGLLNAWWCS